MRVLIACEFSGIVRDAFAKYGHDSMSCDLLPSETIPYGNSTHYHGNVLEFITSKRFKFDLMIAHPPCTYLAISGARWFKDKLVEQAAALEFVRKLMDAPIPRIAIENPISIISSRIRKPDQIIQPWQFGHDASKKTCLWLKNLPLLAPTQIIEPSAYGCACGFRFERALGKYGCPNCHGNNRVKNIWANQTPSGQNKIGPSKNRATERSRTYKGIAEAMSRQWGQ